MKVSPVGVDLKVNNNYFRVTNDKENNIETSVRDNSSYKLKISQKALELLLENYSLNKVIPKVKKEALVYNNKGQI